MWLPYEKGEKIFKALFKENHDFILKLLNTEGAKLLLGARQDLPIYHATPNSIHQLLDIQEGNIYTEARFWCGLEVGSLIYKYFDYLNIIKQYDMKSYPIGFDEAYKLLLHATGLERSRKFPQLFQSNFSVGSGNGNCAYNNASTWATAHNASSSTDVENNVDGTNPCESSFNNPGYYLRRSFFPADTSSITNAQSVSSGYLQLYCAKNTIADSPTSILVSTSQASTSSLSTSDYASVGTTTFASNLISSLSSSQSLVPWNLNAAGKAAISLTGTTKMGLRLDLDINNTTPTGSNSIFPCAYQSNGTAGNRPVYVLTLVANSTQEEFSYQDAAYLAQRTFYKKGVRDF